MSQPRPAATPGVDVLPAVDLLPDVAGASGDDAARAVPVAKGHGTQNDFVLVPDPDGRLTVGPDLVALLCDRRAGLGGDGLIRVVRCTAIPDGVALADRAEWFMDYRNADGSVAEMCGNGIRVFVAYLRRLGLVDLEDGETLPVGTRAGVLSVRRDGDLLAADLGAWRIVGGAAAVEAGSDATVEVDGIEASDGEGRHGTVARPGLSVDVGNPHTVVVLAQDDDLARADLTVAPAVEPAPVDGTNVELVVPLGEQTAPDGTVVGRVRMRVHERGVGETRSCGTGAVAAAAAVRAWGGAQAPDVWLVDVPGGTVQVTLHADGTADLAGPAVLVAQAEVDLTALTVPSA